jgi:hypothetical protein
MFEFRSRGEDLFSYDLAPACTETRARAPRHQVDSCFELRLTAGGARRHRPASAAASCRAGLGESGAHRGVDTILSAASGRKQQGALCEDNEAAQRESRASDLSGSDPQLSALTFAKVVAAPDRFLTRKWLCTHHGWRSPHVAGNAAAVRSKLLILHNNILCLRVIYMLRRGRARDKIFSLDKSAPVRSGDKMASQ